MATLSKRVCKFLLVAHHVPFLTYSTSDKVVPLEDELRSFSVNRHIVYGFLLVFYSNCDCNVRRLPDPDDD